MPTIEEQLDEYREYLRMFLTEQPLRDRGLLSDEQLIELTLEARSDHSTWSIFVNLDNRKNGAITDSQQSIIDMAIANGAAKLAVSPSRRDGANVYYLLWQLSKQQRVTNVSSSIN